MDSLLNLLCSEKHRKKDQIAASDVFLKALSNLCGHFKVNRFLILRFKIR